MVFKNGFLAEKIWTPGFKKWTPGFLKKTWWTPGLVDPRL